ncbi:hypothetical protein [Peribacillus sp. YIM B13477]
MESRYTEAMLDHVRNICLALPEAVNILMVSVTILLKSMENPS